MRTRRSRFFVVLLHLIGCQYHLPTSGIVGVHPWPIILEHLDAPLPNEPLWIQDDSGQCLGPAATFCACGDATLWMVRPLKKLRMGLFGVEEHARDAISLQLVDMETTNLQQQQDDDDDDDKRKRRRRRRRLNTQRTECLAISKQKIGLQTCTSKFSSKWAWQVNPQGILSVHGDATRCLDRDTTHTAVLGGCQQHLSFVRFRTVAPSAPQPAPPARRPFQTLQNTNPILWANQQHTISSSTPPRRRTIQVHPYIQAAQNHVYTDPETGLEFPTDLADYLGNHNGRHTLMGVGQYKKFVVKVYGVAYYVSKRDVLLASRVFAPYARLTAPELRERPDFYQHLRQMEADNGFDRTIMIKTNMQLASETIRSSLHADWTMLTDQAKRLLIGTSLQARPADARMLEIIRDPANPSRCSCGQIAPEADPDCCARGTELVFTWTKDGTLEVRLNGRVVEIFHRPDIAEGIFFEYLRLDDPMSYSLLEHVVDGFPFLLGPLSQVQGLHIESSPKKKKQNVVKAIAGALDGWTSHVAGNVQRLSDEAIGHTIENWKNFQSGAQGILQELDRRREWAMKQIDNVSLREIVVKAPETVVRLVTQDKAETIQAVTNWVNSSGPSEGAVGSAGQIVENFSIFAPLSRWFGEVYYAPDEIGPMMIRPSHDFTRKVFLALVHLYLLLLFIVSFPESYRTRLVVRKSKLALQTKTVHPRNGPVCVVNEAPGQKRPWQRADAYCL